MHACIVCFSFTINPNMEAAIKTTFDPSSDLIQEEDCNTLLLYLPGFTKDHLKVQLTRTRDLKISGNRPLENNKLSTFQKDFHVAENCDTNKISAKFEDGILYIRQPKTTPSQTPQPQPQPLKLPAKIDTPQPQKPAHEPRPAPKIDPPRPAPKMDPPRPAAKMDPPTPKKAAQVVEEIKQTATAKKSVDESRETKKASERSTGEGEGGKKEEIIRKRAEEKSGGAAEKGAGSGRGRGVEADYKQLNAGSPAARLKAARQQITNGLLLVLVFALGIYVSKLPWFSKP